MTNSSDNLFTPLNTAVPEETRHILEFILENLRLIAAGIVVLLVVVGGIAAYRSWQDSSVQKSRNELSKLSAVADIPALETFAKAAPAAVRFNAWLEVARLAETRGDQPAAVEAYAEILKSGPADFRPLAAMGQAGALLRQGKAAEALELLNANSKDVPASYKGPMLHLAASTAEQAGNPAEALRLYRELATLPEQPDAEFIQAKVAELQKAPAAATPGK